MLAEGQRPAGSGPTSSLRWSKPTAAVLDQSRPGWRSPRGGASLTGAPPSGTWTSTRSWPVVLPWRWWTSWPTATCPVAVATALAGRRLAAPRRHRCRDDPERPAPGRDARCGRADHRRTAAGIGAEAVGLAGEHFYRWIHRGIGREIGPGAFLGMTLAYEAAMVVAVRRPIEREDAAWLVPGTWPQTRTDRYGATPMGRGSRRGAAGCAGTRAEAGMIGRPSGLANDDPPRAASQPRVRGEGQQRAQHAG